MSQILCCLYFLAGITIPLCAQQPTDLQVIRQRIVDDLLEHPVNDKSIATILDQQQEEGNWPDIDYVDTTRTGFQHGQHLSRMVALSQAFSQSTSEYFQSPKVREALFRSLDYWLAHDFICENWWWNQIGTTGRMVNVLLLMREELSEEQMAQAVKIVDRSHLEASGARPSGDRIKMAGILAKKLLVLEDQSAFDAVIRVIETEIKFSEGRGMQVDYSFHHRQDRVNNTLSYGLGYAQAFAEWADLVAGTKYEFGDTAIRQLVDYFLDGICKMAVHGLYPDLGAKNRSVSREGALRQMGTEMIRNLLAATNYRTEELQEILAIREGNRKNERTFNKFFWQTEYMSHQRPAFFGSVRMYSTRNQNMESPYNSEGLKNHYLGDGAQFISRTGQEYYNIFPVWDWRRIPGTTVVQKPGMPPENLIRQEGITEFVGGVSDGRYGAAVFDYVKEMDSLQARKAWFFFDDSWVCLGADIRSGSVFPVNTTVNQSHLSGKVLVSGENSIFPLWPQSRIHSDDIGWIWHDSIGYYFPNGGDVYISNQNQSGSWYEINRQSDSPKEEIIMPVFKLWMDHGKNPVGGSYAYVVIPAVTRSFMENGDYGDGIRILANTAQIQAAQHRLERVVQAVFYEPGTLEISNDLLIEMKDAGLIMIRYRNGHVLSVTVADPSRKLSEIRFSISQMIKLKNHHTAVELYWDPVHRTSDFTVNLPDGARAGSSMVLESIGL